MQMPRRQLRWRRHSPWRTGSSDGSWRACDSWRNGSRARCGGFGELLVGRWGLPLPAKVLPAASQSAGQ